MHAVQSKQKSEKSAGPLCLGSTKNGRSEVRRPNWVACLGNGHGSKRDYVMFGLSGNLFGPGGYKWARGRVGRFILWARLRVHRPANLDALPHSRNGHVPGGGTRMHFPRPVRVSSASIRATGSRKRGCIGGREAKKVVWGSCLFGLVWA
jgi:hypothetical protein